MIRLMTVTLALLIVFIGLSGSARAECVVGVKSNDVLNMREAPNGLIVVGMDYNACDVTVNWNSCSGQWCEVSWRGFDGWVHTRYLERRAPSRYNVPASTRYNSRCAELRRLCHDENSAWGCSEFRADQCECVNQVEVSRCEEITKQCKSECRDETDLRDACEASVCRRAMLECLRLDPVIGDIEICKQ